MENFESGRARAQSVETLVRIGWALFVMLLVVLSYGRAAHESASPAPEEVHYAARF